MEKLKGFLKLIRWFHELAAIVPFVGLYFVIDYFIQAGGYSCNLSGFNFFLLCICVQLHIAAGCILNDIMDRKIDKINKPHTHIIGRVLSLRTAWISFGVTSVGILLLSVYISCCMFNEWAFISPGIYVLSVLYDVYFKRTPLMGNILIAAITSFIPLVLFFFAKDCIARVQHDKIDVLIYLYCFFSLLIIVPRELSLDISDMEGDKAVGCRTLPILIGAKRSKLLVSLMILLIVMLSVLVMYYYAYLLLTLLLIDVLLLCYCYRLQQCTARIDYIRAGRFLWFIFIAGLVGFTVATICS